MDSKLPKPSSLRRPAIKACVPSDRLVHHSTQPTSSTVSKFAAPQSRTILTQNFANVCNALAGPKVKQVRLRRSMSLNDISDMVNIRKRPAEPLVGGPAKTRYNFPPNRPIAIKKTITKSIAKPLAAAKPKPTATVTNTTAASKSLNAPKISKFDFKARFENLLEKHKALKSKHDTQMEQLLELERLPELYDHAQEELSNLKSEFKKVENENYRLSRENNENKEKIDNLSVKLELTSKKYKEVSDEKENLLTKNREMKQEIIDLKNENDNLKEENASIIQSVDNFREALFKFNIERKELHNTIMDLRGNIRVFCRVRPPLPTEMDRTICSWQYNDENSLEIMSVENGKKQVKHDFAFDQVFPPSTDQNDIFECVSPLIQSALDGYNICIFAYGQTGSGKTFTMDGTEVNHGIIPNTIDFLYECFIQNKKLGWEFTLTASFLEIYNEQLYDLLSNEAKEMDIKMVSAKTPNEIFVSNLTEVDVDTKDELHKLMFMAKQNRATASTVGNERSSRSHAVTRLRITGIHVEKNEISQGTINLIDLAGSESPKNSVRMEETKKINKSLSELTNVIMALVQKNDHIPYRNSKLTHLLMPCLGGNSKTLMFVNVSPFQDCFIETVKSLRFASTVNSCKVAKAKKNKSYANSSLSNSSSISN